MNLLKIAWRPFASYRSEESGTLTHLIDKAAPKTLCGKEPLIAGSGWGSAPAAGRYCKRCLKSAQAKGVSREAVKGLSWHK